VRKSKTPALKKSGARGVVVLGENPIEEPKVINQKGDRALRRGKAAGGPGPQKKKTRLKARSRVF